MDLEELRARAEASQLAYEEEKAKERAFVEAEKAAGRFPEGFDAVVWYPDPNGGMKIREGEVSLRVNPKDPARGVFEFSTREGLPALPLKGYGLSWSEGWDIPTRWAIDASGRGWVDNAHGHSLDPVEDLLSYFGDDEGTRREIRAILGRKPEMPSWMKTALSAGWTPPSDFDRNNYEP